jgi:hypothetical protein
MLALVRLLACMSSDVDGKCAPLDEALATVRSHARIRSLICVYSVVSLEVRFPIKAL